MSVPELDNGLTEKDLLVQSNPEAMLDVLTIRSMRSRYIEHDVTSVASEPLNSLDRDLDTFVRDFQINDSISDIFLMEDEPKKSKVKQTFSGSTNSSKASKKSARRTQSVDNLLETPDSTMITKKPKTFSSLFSRKGKPKAEIRKAKAVTWHQESNDVTPSPKRPKSKGSNSGVTHCEESGYMTMNKATVPGGSSNPLRSNEKRTDFARNKSKSSPDIDGEYAVLHTVCSNNTKFDQLVAHIDNENMDALAHDLACMSSELAMTLCDMRGNNVLHKCVLKNKPQLLTPIVSIHPQLANLNNKEEITPVELAIKLGRTGCLKTFLDKCLPTGNEKSQGQIESWLSYGIQSRQAKSVDLIFDHLGALAFEARASLPARGKRAAPSHVAAARDDIASLQRLVELGFDVTHGGNESELPLHVAYNKGSRTSFRYLLLLHVFESALGEALRLCHKQDRDLQISNQINERLHLLEAATAQFQSIVEKQATSSRRCLQIVDNMIENKENIQNTEQLSLLKKHLSLINKEDQAPDLSRRVGEIVALSRQRDLQSQSSLGHEEAHAKTKDILKRLHQSWTAEDFDMSCLVRDSLYERNNETINMGVNRTRMDSKVFFGRNVSRFCDKDISSEHPKTQNTSAIDTDPEKSARQKMEITNVSEPIHPLLHKKVSHDYATIDKDSIESQNLASSVFVDRNGKYGGASAQKKPLAHTKSPEYAIINTDLGNSKCSDRGGIDEQSELSDDSMSTISSHNSTLQSAVGRLNRRSFSDTDSSGSDVPPSRNRRDHFIGQFDVSDFSTDASSDLWSASRCTSCFSQTNSQMTSYYSDDETECYNYVRLNLENEDLPDELLRNHRLCRHLEAVKRLNTENDDVIETVVTASGERIGSTTQSDDRFINVSDTSRKTESEKSTKQETGKKRKKPRVKLFDPGELVSKRELSQSEFLERYDRSADVDHARRHDDLDLPWDQLQFSDVEEEMVKHKPWYDVSEDEESLAHAWSSDSETSTLCDSSQE